MRIRKTASKVLGLSSSFRSPPPAEDYHCADALPEELLLCQLNCSPWDVMELESNLPHFTFQEGGGDEGRGIMGNGFKFQDYDQILPNPQESAAAAFTRLGAELNSEEGDDKKAELNSEEGEDKKKKKKRRGRKRKEEVINVIIREDNKAATKNSSITLCKKNDGKGWQCKRPANLQHSLCNHHLGLLRNYSSRTNSNRESYEPETDQHRTIKNQRPKAAAVESAGDGFYYYSGFGPCRGKKRSGGTSADHARRTKGDASEDEDDDEKESDAPVAGDDLDDDTDEEDDDDVEIKGRYRKNGRRRVKARSLKSLM